MSIRSLVGRGWGWGSVGGSPHDPHPARFARHPPHKGEGRTEFAAHALALYAPFSAVPHFSSIARASVSESAEVGGNCSSHANGRHASMITFESAAASSAAIPTGSDRRDDAPRSPA